MPAPTQVDLTFRFPDEETARCFANWLSDGGEQAFYEHCNIIGREVGRWQYHKETQAGPHKIKYGPFLADRLVILHPPE